MKETMDNKTTILEYSLYELLGMYVRKWWVIGIFLVAFAAAAAGFTWKFVTPTYQAKISIYVNNSRGAQEMDSLSSADLSAAQRLVNTYVSITKSNRVLEKVVEELDGEYTVGQLYNSITASQMSDTEIFSVYVVYTDPVEAARIANAIAKVAPGEIANLIEGTSAKVIDTAKVPTKRHSPNYSRRILFGAVAGAFLALVLLTVQYLSDTRIKDENDLINMFNIPILGRIPDFESDVTESTYGSSTEEVMQEQEQEEDEKEEAAEE